MTTAINRRTMLRLAAAAGTVGLSSGLAPAQAQGVTLRLSAPATPTDQRAIALTEVFGPAVKDFATFQPHWNATLFRQGTELEAIARNNLEMSITSPQELATLIPGWSIFTAGYLLRDADHQKKVFADPLMNDLKKTTEDRLGVKLLSVMYLGRRQVNLRGEKEVRTPADLAGVKLRMPNSEAWLFLGTALGANPLPLAFTEIYTALQSGAVDGQDNPLPTVRD
ncbi:MAG: TRAP transporter substrate-binding protein DctP, partial [Hyphomicrobiales bacterium]|nr:TRAP transporter substrate-binding protein DctP [Hyphomicrobiales bacterium]